MQIQEIAPYIARMCRENNAGGTEAAQVYALGEEVGEFIGAMRRWRGMARRKGTEEEAQNELADVIISAYVMAEIMGWDANALVDIKVGAILNRPWKEA